MTAAFSAGLFGQDSYRKQTLTGHYRRQRTERQANQANLLMVPEWGGRPSAPLTWLSKNVLPVCFSGCQSGARTDSLPAKQALDSPRAAP